MRTLFTSFLLLSLILTGCEPEKPGEPDPNRSPETRLSNIPPDSITSSSPLLTLSWLGDDADGFVTAYRYTWTFQQSDTSAVERNVDTYILNIIISEFALVMLGDASDAPKVYKYFSTLPPEGLDTATVGRFAAGDTVIIEGVGVYASNPDGVRYPTHVSPTTGTFIFESQDTLNPHTFEVAAIDNLGMMDPSAAEVTFFTPLVEPPDVFVSDFPADTVLVLTNFTDTFTGVEFGFTGFDPNSRTIEYSWVIDRDIWTDRGIEPPWSEWSMTPRAFVKAGDFPDTLATDHIIYVRGRNEFGSISTRGYFTRFDESDQTFDTIWAHTPFRTIFPEFAQAGSVPRILIVNNTFNWDTLNQPIRPNWAALRQYYAEIYDALGLAGQYDIVNVEETTGSDFPGRGQLGQYSVVHLMADVGNNVNKFPQLGLANQAKLQDYCYVGGKLFISGWAFASPINIPAGSPAEFLNNILHVESLRPVIAAQWIGSVPQPIAGEPSYPPAPFDATKIDTSWGMGPGLPWLANLRPYGFGEIIYRYDADDDFASQGNEEGFFFIEGVPLGIRYLGLTYDSILLHFPLYYTEQTTAIEIVRRVLFDFCYPSIRVCP